MFLRHPWQKWWSVQVYILSIFNRLFKTAMAFAPNVSSHQKGAYENEIKAKFTDLQFYFNVKLELLLEQCFNLT